MPRPVIRPAEDADWNAIAALLQDCSLPLEGAREHLPAFLVAVGDGDVVGSAGLEVYGDVALLRSVAVSPAWRGQGVGRALAQAVYADAHRRGVKTLHLLTTTAAAYFSNLGFESETREHVPAALEASAEFHGACPSSAAYMSRNVNV